MGQTTNISRGGSTAVGGVNGLPLGFQEIEIDVPSTPIKETAPGSAASVDVDATIVLLLAKPLKFSASIPN